MNPPVTISQARRLWMSLSTGMPLALFKFAAGIAAAQDIHPIVGACFMVWGVLDAVLNLAVLVPSFPVSFCTLSNIGRWLQRRYPGHNQEELFLGIDTLASFLIVSTMIWFDRIGRLPGPLPRIWGMCVIANVLGAGIDRIWQARQVSEVR